MGTEGYEPIFADVNICALVREIMAENYCDFEDHGINVENSTDGYTKIFVVKLSL